MIFFFGGYMSTADDVESWRKSIVQLPTDGDDIEVYPYPKGATAGNPLTKWKGSKTLALRMKSVPLADHYIVGHSSGCAIANDVAAQAVLMGVLRFSLIVLDGFKPSRELLSRSSTQCWSAICGNKKSLNYDALQGTPNFKVFKATGCTKLWPLHFSLVNLNANDSYPMIRHGYRNCMANLMWKQGGSNNALVSNS